MDKRMETKCHIPQFTPEVETLAVELLGHIADKWTMLVLEELGEHGTLRFNELRRLLPAISQKMLTQTLRQMERLGLIERQVFAEIPPRVEYQRTAMGHSLGQAVCAVWSWVEGNAEPMQQSIDRFDSKRRLRKP